jgi:hypothetical protein
MTTREKAREQTLKVNGLIKVYKQNSSAGQIFSFEYKRWLVGQIKLRDKLWSQA